MANLLAALARLVDVVLALYMLVVIARALISWVSPDPFNPVVTFLRRATDPLLDRIRRFVPLIGSIDISPLILILFVWVVRSVVVSTLYDLARAFR